jgi:hypothetical protein
MKSLNILHRCLTDMASRDITRDFFIRSDKSSKITGHKLLEDENDLESIFRRQLSKKYRIYLQELATFYST